MNKRAETSLRAMLKRYGWYWHKYGDVRYCPSCHQVLPKSENAPDFASASVYTYIEAKNSTSDGTWLCSELLPTGARAKQREWLVREGGWLYIELGEGRVPNKNVWLVPFDEWSSIVEPTLVRLGMKSIRKERWRDRPGADELLAKYSLIWEQGGWAIPDGHIWWVRLADQLRSQLQAAERHIHAPSEYYQGDLFRDTTGGHEGGS